MEELAACKKRQNVELEICEKYDHQKTAWKRIKAASRGPDMNLANLSGLSDAILCHVATMTQLKSVCLYKSSGFSAEGIKHLYRLPRLEKLSFHNTDVSDNALEGIGSLTRLKELYLNRTKVTDAGLLLLTALPSLELLGIFGCKGVSNAGMVHVGRLTGLTRLDLGSTAVTDDGLQQLTALTKLTTLQLPNGIYVPYVAARRWIGR
ncbi:unnamed protein product [Closterium sp. Yama58-4]|nr:unnamed protein product [Closterium sp. Yama58-4]